MPILLRNETTVENKENLAYLLNTARDVETVTFFRFPSERGQGFLIANYFDGRVFISNFASETVFNARIANKKHIKAKVRYL